ncbi:MAG: hypothetical protein ACK41T_06140 [Pseudobdellovibrio sp.]
MKLLMTIVFAFMASTSVFAARLCPINSCNPHNGCVEGCSKQSISGLAQCSSDDPKFAETQAINAAHRQAQKMCGSNYVLRSSWVIKTLTENDQCFVKAEALIRCY